MARVMHLSLAPQRRLTMEELSEVQAVADAGFEGCAHARPGMLRRVIEGGIIRCGDTIEKYG